LRGRVTMEQARMVKRHVERQSARLAAECVRGAGRYQDVAEALGVAKGTVGHLGTDRPDRYVTDYARKLMTGVATDGLATLQAIEDAYEMQVAAKDTETLLAEGLDLIAKESALDGAEDESALRGPLAHADSIDRYRLRARALSIRERLLWERGVDLLNEYRNRRKS